MIEFLENYGIISLIVTGLFSALTGMVGWMIKQLIAIKRGMLATLRNDIVHTYNAYKALGYITYEGLETINDLYEQYITLGGNGAVKQLKVHGIDKLPIKTEEE